MQMILSFTLAELWALHIFVRQASGSPEHGKEWDKEVMLEVYKGITGLEQRPREEWVLLCSESFLWQITRQVPEQYRMGNSLVGHSLLLKAMAELVKAEVEDVPSSQRDPSPREDTHGDTRADSGPGTAPEPGETLPQSG